MEVAIDATYELKPFFQAVKRGDWDTAVKFQQAIVEVEHKADHIKKEVRTHLPKSLFLPVSRGDILAMISAQDKVANQAKDIAGLMLGRKMQIPATMQSLFDQLLEQSIAACRQAKKAIDELDELLESGFRGNEIHVVDTMIDTLDQIEHETDDIQISLRKELFGIERELYAVDVIFLYKAIEAVGGLADRAHEVGGKLQALLAH
jgi:predicted phosphate transport protein (TIGR00153 family)